MIPQPMIATSYIILDSLSFHSAASPAALPARRGRNFFCSCGAKKPRKTEPGNGSVYLDSSSHKIKDNVSIAWRRRECNRCFRQKSYDMFGKNWRTASPCPHVQARPASAPSGGRIRQKTAGKMLCSTLDFSGKYVILIILPFWTEAEGASAAKAGAAAILK